MEQAYPLPKQNKDTTSQEAIELEKGHIDFPFFILLLLLLIIGLVSLFSASHPYAYYYRETDSFYFIYKQVIFAASGLMGLFIASNFDFRHFQRITWLMLGGTILLLVLVLALGKRGEANRWLNIGSFTLQPSEVAKFTIVAVFASMIYREEGKLRTLKGLVPYVAILGAYAVLIYLEPHLSGMVLVVGLGGVMLFVGGARFVHLLLYAGGGGLAFLVLQKLRGIGYASTRIEVWRNPWPYAKGDGYQNIQALLAIGSGGWMGVGVGKSSQKYLYLPEPQNDFIFAVVCEEVGFIGAVIIILLFALLVWRGFVIASRCPHRFGSLLAIGLTAQVGLQVLFNIMVVTMIIPNTGISLPFFSSGGSSLIMLLAQMGVILNISRYRKVPDTSQS